MSRFCHPEEFALASDRKDLSPVLTGTIEKLLTNSADTTKRQVRVVMNRESEDRSGDVIEAAGWDLRDYKKNPVVIMFHNGRSFPVAKAVKVWVEGKSLMGILQFADEGTSAESDLCYNLVKQDILKGVSVGFNPKEWSVRRGDKEEFLGIRFHKQSLSELSFVPVGCHPDALVTQKSNDLLNPLHDTYKAMDAEWMERGFDVVVDKTLFDAAFEASKSGETPEGIEKADEAPKEKEELKLGDKMYDSDNAYMGKIVKTKNGLTLKCTREYQQVIATKNLKLIEEQSKFEDDLETKAEENIETETVSKKDNENKEATKVDNVESQVINSRRNKAAHKLRILKASL